MDILGLKSITTYEIGTGRIMNMNLDRFETLSIILTGNHIYFEHTEKPTAKTLIFGYQIAKTITPHETFRASDINVTHSVIIEFDDGFILDTNKESSILELVDRNLGQKYHNVVVSNSSLGTIFITIFFVTDEMLQFSSYYHFEQTKKYQSHYENTICDFGYVSGNKRSRVQFSFYVYLMAGKHAREMMFRLVSNYIYDNERYILVEDAQKVNLYRTKYRFLYKL